MGLRINTNVSSLSAQRALSKVKRDLDDNFRKLSSGHRITRAGDDAAGLAISERLNGHIRGNRQAKRNAEDAISLVQIAEGAMGEISNIIIRLRELSIQAASDTIGDEERKFTNLEFQSLKEELDRIAKTTDFNGVKLLDGSSPVLEFQIGIHNDPFLDRLKFDGSSNATTLNDLNLAHEGILSKEGAQASLAVLDNAITRVSGIRANLGATQNRLASVINTLSIADENLSAANSRIRDVDFAAETSKLTSNKILLEAATQVLAQANTSSQLALKLLDVG